MRSESQSLYLQGSHTPMAIDPAKCRSSDKSHVYWAAKDQVFKFPFNPDKPIFYVDEKAVTGIHLRARKEIPQAPNPNEPEGCRDNPLRGLSVPYMSSYEAALYERLFGRSYKKGWQGNGFYAVPTGYESGIYGKSIDQATIQRQSCRTRESGIRECVKVAGQKLGDYSYAHVLKINAFTLEGYSQNEIQFLAQYNLAPSNAFVNVKSNTLLFGNVLLSINPAILPVEIDAMIEYHKELVRYMVRSHVGAYPWASRK